MKMKTLSSESILTLLGLRSTLKRVEKKAKELGDDVKEALVEQLGRKPKDGDREEYAPSTCAFKFVLQVDGRSDVGWRDEWYSLAVDKWGEEEATERETKLMEKSKKPVASLKIEVNDKYLKREKEKERAKA